MKKFDLKKERKKSGLSQEQLAKAVQEHRNTVARHEGEGCSLLQIMGYKYFFEKLQK